MSVECNEEIGEVCGIKVLLRFPAPTGQIQAGNTKAKVDAAKTAVTRGLQLYAAEQNVKVQKAPPEVERSNLILPR